MDAAKFTSTSISLLRSAVGWQTAIARKLDVSDRTVRRWIEADETPDWVDAKLAELIGATEIAPWPRDEWLIGDARGGDGKRREYIMHLQPPRFVARIVMYDNDGLPLPSEMPADVISGVVYSTDDAVLCEIDWMDEVPAGEHVHWLETAATRWTRSMNDRYQPGQCPLSQLR